MIALAQQSASLQQSEVLARLREAGSRGVPYFELRDLLGGQAAESVLDSLRAIGHRIQRTPSRDGVLAILLDDAEVSR